jgi:hypothetical protein
MAVKKTPAQLQREIDEVLASPGSFSYEEAMAALEKKHAGVKRGGSLRAGHAPVVPKMSAKTKWAKAHPRVAYRLQLTPSEMRAVEFARGRYAWPDMLAAHAAENGAVAFTESEMWQWCDDVDSDAEGGHAPFPLASGALATKLQNFYDERV